MSTTTQITSFEIEKFAKKFTFGKTDGFREGLYVHLKDTDENTATGEVSPLPGRSLETLDEAHQNLLALKNNFMENDLKPLTLHPSVMFGMQMALYSLQQSSTTPSLPITKLLITPPLLAPKGPVKLKLGDFRLDAAIAFFNKCDRSKKTIRIDLERKWSLAKTIDFCKLVNSSSILYIEDPVENYTDLETFYEKTGVEYALDQFLLFAPPESIKLLKGLHSIIVKPSLTGGLHECRLVQDAFAPIPISLSSLFETKVGIGHIKLISSILCGDQPVGVDTLKFIK